MYGFPINNLNWWESNGVNQKTCASSWAQPTNMGFEETTHIGRKVMDGRFLTIHVGGVDIGFQVKHWYFSEAGLFKNSGPWYRPTCKASFTSWTCLFGRDTFLSGKANSNNIMRFIAVPLIAQLQYTSPRWLLLISYFDLCVSSTFWSHDWQGFNPIQIANLNKAKILRFTPARGPKHCGGEEGQCTRKNKQ